MWKMIQVSKKHVSVETITEACFIVTVGDDDQRK